MGIAWTVSEMIEHLLFSWLRSVWPRMKVNMYSHVWGNHPAKFDGDDFNGFRGIACREHTHTHTHTHTQIYYIHALGVLYLILVQSLTLKTKTSLVSWSNSQMKAKDIVIVRHFFACRLYRPGRRKAPLWERVTFAMTMIEWISWQRYMISMIVIIVIIIMVIMTTPYLRLVLEAKVERCVWCSTQRARHDSPQSVD